MFSPENKTQKEQLLRVYEVKGARRLPVPPARGLAGVWPQPPYYYLFYWEQALDALAAWLELNPEWRLTSQYSLAYEQWQDISGEEFIVGPFTVCPATFHGPPSANASGISIRIDPGVVFGSGLHPTTRGCLLAISSLFSASSRNDRGSEVIRTVVDFGTGTGLLAIACALLGARRVWAVDCICFALEVARQNALANGAAERIGLICADRIAVMNAASDLLVMNLEWPVLEEVLAGDRWKGYHRVVLSGFLEGMLERVEEIVEPCYITAGRIILEGWPTLTLVRRPIGTGS